jgi:Uma2 family endonuclease
LILERQAEHRSEYVAGMIYAMAGASPTHNLIVANVMGELRAGFKRTPCRVLASHMKTRTSDLDLFSYPDVTVVWGEMRFHDVKQDVLLNPTVIVEVFSPSTMEFDLGWKREAYMALESVGDILLIVQDEPRVEHHSRERDGEWREERVKGLDGKVRLATYDVTLSVAEIYDKVDFTESNS